MLKTLATGALLASVAFPAQAAEVFSNNNVDMGPIVGLPGTVVRRLPPDNCGPDITSCGAFHFIEVAAKNLVRNTLFYFQSTNCIGTRFIPYDPTLELLPTARFDENGHFLWGADFQFATPGVFTMESELVVNGQKIDCVRLHKDRQIAAIRAFQSELTPMPPFTVK